MRTLFLLALVTAAASQAALGPKLRSYRSLAIGGAGVAIVDDRDAVHLNPAGLTQIGAKGTFVPLDTLGYWRERLELQWDPVGLDLPAGTLLDLYDYQTKYKGYYANKDTLLNHPEVYEALYAFDRLPVPLNWHGQAEWAIHNYGVGAWGEIEPSVMFDHGAILPSVEIGLRTVQAVELATARAFLDDRLSLGVGYRIAAISEETRYIGVEEVQSGEFTEAAKEVGDSVYRRLIRTGDWGHGLDFGVLYYQTPGLRYGGAIQNVGMKIGSDFVTPNLSIGTAWSPRRFQRNDKWGRKINFAASLDELLDDERGYKPLSKIGIGMEWTQTVIPKILTGRLAAGLKGGYPTAGVQGELFRFLHCEMVTYADEMGSETGVLPQRYYLLKFGGGF